MAHKMIASRCLLTLLLVFAGAWREASPQDRLSQPGTPWQGRAGSPFGFYGPQELSAYFGDRSAYVRKRDYAAFARVLKDAGADWVYAFDVTMYRGGRDFIDAFAAAGFFISGGVPAGFGALDENRWLPKDLVGYRASLKDYFEKYRAITHWQIGDEFDGGYWSDTPENFAVMFRLAYKALKEVNPRAQLVLGKQQEWLYTFLKNAPSPEESARRGSMPFVKRDRGRAFGLRLLEELERLERLEKNPRRANPYRDKLSKQAYRLLFGPDEHPRYVDSVVLPLWTPTGAATKDEHDRVIATLRRFGLENGILPWNVDAGSWYGYMIGEWNPPGGGGDLAPTLPPERIDEREGCRGLVYSIAPLLAHGVEKTGFGGYLVNFDGSKRLEWFTHKLLAQKLAGFTGAEEVAAGQFKFRFKDRDPVWVVWSAEEESRNPPLPSRKAGPDNRPRPPGKSQRVVLNVGAVKAVIATTAIPREATGREVESFETAFDRKPLAVRNGKAEVVVGGEPVFIEPEVVERVDQSPEPQQGGSRRRSENPFGIWDGGLDPDWAKYLGELKPAANAVVVPPLFFDKNNVEAGWPDLRRIYDEHVRLGIEFIPLNDLEHGGIDMPLAELDAAVRKAVRSFPEMKTIMIGCEADGGSGPKVGSRPRDYALRVRVAYRAVKAVRPQCRVAVGGGGGNAASYGPSPRKVLMRHPLHNPGYFDAVFRELESLEAIEKDPGSYDWERNPSRLSREEFELVFSPDAHDKYQDIHHISLFVGDHRKYRDGEHLGAVRAVKALLREYGYRGTDIWITQAGTHSGAIKSKFLQGPPQTEREQAASLVKQYLVYRSWGVRRVFWTSTVEFDWPEDFNATLGAPGNPHHYFSLVGLVHNGKGEGDPGHGVRKLAYHSYRLLVEKLATADWDGLKLVRDDQVVVFRLPAEASSAYVAWREPDRPGPATVELPVGSKGAVVTSLIPSEREGKLIKGNRAAFAIRRLATVDGRATLDLPTEPVLIEGMR